MKLHVILMTFLIIAQTRDLYSNFHARWRDIIRLYQTNVKSSDGVASDI